MHHLWSLNDSSGSAFSVPAVANMMVVSRSPMIPLTVLAALMQACVPLAPDCSAARTLDTCRKVTTGTCNINNRLQHYLRSTRHLSTASTFTVPDPSIDKGRATLITFVITQCC